ncbi:hypothetical protein TSUD_250480 [Trifolium subterraneum]|nr:hypothetical protein TSUD_250480 [Trifolium subterraneum]
MATSGVHLLPQEVIMEILLRLPVKSLLRFRCVCKSWHSLISHDSHFATSHFQLSASPTNRIILLDSYPPNILSIDIDSSLNHSANDASLNLHFLSYRPQIGGSCRGFLFLLHNYFYEWYLWNPSTGVHKQIPTSPILIEYDHYNFGKMLSAFTYNPSTDDYLIVLGTYKYNRDINPVYDSIDLEVFSLRANDWKQIEVGSHLPYSPIASSDGTITVGLFFHASIHWLVNNYDTKRNVVIALDLKDMTMSEMTLPDYFSSHLDLDCDLFVFGGRIGAWIVEQEMQTVEIWVMQEYALHSSWTKTLTFSFHSDLQFTPLCFTNCGDIVGIFAYGGLVKFDDKGEQLEYRSFHDRYIDRYEMVVFTESLLSFPAGTEQA